jgi:phage shock protein E
LLATITDVRVSEFLEVKMVLRSVLVAAACLFCAPMVMAIDHTMDELSTVRRNVDEKKAVIVDVREESEWKAGHLNAATHLPLSEIRKNLDVEAVKKKLPKNKIVYTHCKVGARALTSALILERLGYDVRPLKPGYDELIRAGFPKAE